MGKLHTLRRAILRDPESWVSPGGRATGAFCRGERGTPLAGKWSPAPLWIDSYQGFVARVLRGISRGDRSPQGRTAGSSLDTIRARAPGAPIVEAGDLESPPPSGSGSIGRSPVGRVNRRLNAGSTPARLDKSRGYPNIVDPGAVPGSGDLSITFGVYVSRRISKNRGVFRAWARTMARNLYRNLHRRQVPLESIVIVRQIRYPERGPEAVPGSSFSITAEIGADRASDALRRSIAIQFGRAGGQNARA